MVLHVACTNNMSMSLAESGIWSSHQVPALIFCVDADCIWAHLAAAVFALAGE